MQFDDRTVSEILARLRRVEGQVGGIIRMIEEQRECRDVVRQVSAASKALDRVGFKILATGLRECARNADSARENGYSEEELEKLFLQLS